MLVLTRKVEEKITIGDDRKVIITVLGIQGEKVSLGIEADKSTPIIRNELIKDSEADPHQAKKKVCT